MADGHAGGAVVERVEGRFHAVVGENFADAEGVLGQDGDDLLLRDDFDVLLDAAVLAAGKMAAIGRAGLAEGLAGKKIDLDDARMELGDAGEVHGVGPDRRQRRVDDDFLPGLERWRHVAGARALLVDDYRGPEETVSQTFFRPFGACVHFPRYPRLAPWAGFFRRSAAAHTTKGTLCGASAGWIGNDG